MLNKIEEISHEEVLELIELFGLSVDYDQWNVDGKNWIRVKSTDWPEEFGYPGRRKNLILYKYNGRSTIIGELQMSLINLGGNIKAKEFRKLLNL